MSSLVVDSMNDIHCKKYTKYYIDSAMPLFIICSTRVSTQTPKFALLLLISQSSSKVFLTVIWDITTLPLQWTNLKDNQGQTMDSLSKIGQFAQTWAEGREDWIHLRPWLTCFCGAMSWSVSTIPTKILIIDFSSCHLAKIKMHFSLIHFVSLVTHNHYR